MKTRSELLPAIALLGALALIALAIVRPIGPEAPAAQPGKMNVSGGDYQSLSYAVSRVFGPRVLPRDDDGRSEFRVGALPPMMPFELPMPPGTTVVGSLSNELPDSAEIVLDTNTPVDDALAFYRQGLIDQGFVGQEPTWLVQGFQPDGGASGYYDHLCRPRDSVAVDFSVTPREGKPASIWVYANWHVQSVSCLAQNGEGVIGVAEKLLPLLKTPAGSIMTGSGGGSSSESGMASQEVEIEYPTTARKMADYLVPQLKDSGWMMLESNVSDYGAWSTWSLKDAEGHAWAGSLVVITGPVTNRVSIRLEVRRQP